MKPLKKPLGQILLDRQLITQDQLQAAILRQAKTHERLGRTLVQLGFIEEIPLCQLLAEQFSIPFIRLNDFALQQSIAKQLPEFISRLHRVLLLKKEADSTLICMIDPLDVVAYDTVSSHLPGKIEVALLLEEDLIQALDGVYRNSTELHEYADALSLQLQQHSSTPTSIDLGLSDSESPVAKLLQSIFKDAISMGASDIHLEPEEYALRIRLRIDGFLHEQIINDAFIIPALILRLKLLANLNIAEKRLPQDGRFTLRVKESVYDVRLSSLPVQFGESVVMRLLNQSSHLLNLEESGMPLPLIQQLRRIAQVPNGVIIVTGPTGSGKSTTLYSLLNELNQTDRNIVTVEDPVEYRLKGINQVQIQTPRLGFADALRSILRQDPDLIMIGELRDHETVEIALRAAMTGHVVLTTLHTNDAISSAIRLLDMGAESFLISSALRGIVAQRLVRRLCQHCKEARAPSTDNQTWLNRIAPVMNSETLFYGSKGCTHCRHTGFHGQMGIYEIIEWDTNLAEALNAKDMAAMVQIAKLQPHYRPLLLSALDLALEGITSLAEIRRVVGEDILKNEPVES